MFRKNALKSILSFALAAAAFCSSGVQAAVDRMDFESNAQPYLITGVNSGTFCERKIEDGVYRSSGKNGVAFRIVGLLSNDEASDTNSCYELKARICVDKLLTKEGDSVDSGTASVKVSLSTPGGVAATEKTFKAEVNQWTDISMRFVPRSVDFNTLSFSAVDSKVYAGSFSVDDISITKKTVKSIDKIALAENFQFQNDSSISVFSCDYKYNGTSFGAIAVNWYNFTSHYRDNYGGPAIGLANVASFGDDIPESKNPGFFILNMDRDFEYEKFSEEDLGKLVTVKFRMSIINFKNQTPVNVTVETMTGYDATIENNAVKLKTVKGLANKKTYTLIGTQKYDDKRHDTISYSYVIDENTVNVIGYKITVDAKGLYDEDDGWPEMLAYDNNGNMSIFSGLEAPIEITLTEFNDD